MPLLKKVSKIGTGKAIFIPIEWLKYWENVNNQEIFLVEIEINKELRIKPFFVDKEGGNG